MILTEERKENEKRKIQAEIDRLEFSISYAESYERLADNADFTAHLERLKKLVSYHKAEIEAGVSMLPNKHGEARVELVDLIAQNEVLRAQLEAMIAEPSTIIETAKNARETITTLQEKLKELDADPI